MLDRHLIEEFGKRIRQLRTEKGLSQEQLAELTGFHRTYIGMIERGEQYLLEGRILRRLGKIPHL